MNGPEPWLVGARLRRIAAQIPDQIAIAMPVGSQRRIPRRYATHSFQSLEESSNRLASGMLRTGIPTGSRLVVLVPPSFELFVSVFACFKAGMIMVLVDPGLPRSALIECLREVNPDGFLAIPRAHFVRWLLRSKFPNARFNIATRGLLPWGMTMRGLMGRGYASARPIDAGSEDPAAIIFTSGSTGPPKGVLYTQGLFASQVELIQRRYDIAPGEIDLPGFPLFALFNAAMGVTTVVPDMDFRRPAAVDPRLFVEAANQWSITQAFGSPALWNTVARYCQQSGARMPSLRRVLSAGAPVPPHVLERVQAAVHSQAEIHTPYGATEALPVSSITAREVLGETAALSRRGAGTCVGRRFPGVAWRVIEIVDGPLAEIGQTRQLPAGEIGELMVSGPIVTRRYVTAVEANRLHKVSDGDRVWHRMGDVGYLDSQDRFWFCGRKSHRVRTAERTLFTIPCEAISNGHPAVFRSALVGVGPSGAQRPIMIVELWPQHRPRAETDRENLIREIRAVCAANPLTESIEAILIHPSFPVDIRHNSKIFRERLAVWAAAELTARE